jgi:hypothetical protein
MEQGMKYLILLLLISCDSQKIEVEHNYSFELSGAELIQIDVTKDDDKYTLFNLKKHGAITESGTYKDKLRLIAEHDYVKLILKVTINNKIVYNDTSKTHYLEFK